MVLATRTSTISSESSTLRTQFGLCFNSSTSAVLLIATATATSSRAASLRAPSACCATSSCTCLVVDAPPPFLRLLFRVDLPSQHSTHNQSFLPAETPPSSSPPPSPPPPLKPPLPPLGSPKQDFVHALLSRCRYIFVEVSNTSKYRVV